MYSFNQVTDSIESSAATAPWLRAMAWQGDGQWPAWGKGGTDPAWAGGAGPAAPPRTLHACQHCICLGNRLQAFVWKERERYRERCTRTLHENAAENAARLPTFCPANQPQINIECTSTRIFELSMMVVPFAPVPRFSCFHFLMLSASLPLAEDQL